MLDWLTTAIRRPPVTWWDILDIAIVAVVIYEFLKLIRGTRAVQMAAGSLFLLLLFYLSQLAPLRIDPLPREISDEIPAVPASDLTEEEEPPLAL